MSDINRQSSLDFWNGIYDQNYKRDTIKVDDWLPFDDASFELIIADLAR